MTILGRLLHARRWLIPAVAMMAACAAAFPSAAKWRRAESPRFIVYSDGSEGSLRVAIQKLETFDRVMRITLNRPLDAVPDRKLSIYLVRGRSGVTDVVPGIVSGAAGVYLPTTEDIFAVAIREEDEDTLLHEYAHHFMFQEFSGLYPGWLIEGFAEYFATADIEPDSVTLGGYSANRVDWLANTSWIDLDDLLGKRFGQVRPSDRETYYPTAWLMTHWFLGDRNRGLQLNAYLDDIRAGGDPVEAMPRATGLSLSQMQTALRRYFNGRVPQRRLEAVFPVAPVSVTVLPSSADDLLLIGQRLKVGGGSRREATAEEVRRRAARHPDDPFALLQLGHAELHFGDAARGVAVLTALVEREPDNVEALQLLATHALKLAIDDPDQARGHLAEASRLLGRAIAADERDFRSYLLLGQLRERLPTYPTANDIAIWELANQIAPQVNAARLGLAGAYLRADRRPEAIAALLPLANAPHGGTAAEAARTLLERARSDAVVTEAELDVAEDSAAAPIDQPGDAEDPASEPKTDPVQPVKPAA